MKPVDFLLPVTPEVRTSAGRRPRVWLTRFCTSTAARSGSRPMSKKTLIVLTPLLVLEDCMYVMPSTPLTTCSSGVVTALSPAWAFAPVEKDVIETDGGASCG